MATVYTPVSASADPCAKEDKASESGKSSRSDVQCPICFESCSDRNELFLPRCCGVSYHRTCWKRWNVESEFCPTCRSFHRNSEMEDCTECRMRRKKSRGSLGHGMCRTRWYCESCWEAWWSIIRQLCLEHDEIGVTFRLITGTQAGPRIPRFGPGQIARGLRSSTGIPTMASDGRWRGYRRGSDQPTLVRFINDDDRRRRTRSRAVGRHVPERQFNAESVSSSGRVFDNSARSRRLRRYSAPPVLALTGSAHRPASGREVREVNRVASPLSELRRTIRGSPAPSAPSALLSPARSPRPARWFSPGSHDASDHSTVQRFVTNTPEYLAREPFRANHSLQDTVRESLSEVPHAYCRYNSHAPAFSYPCMNSYPAPMWPAGPMQSWPTCAWTSQGLGSDGTFVSEHAVQFSSPSNEVDARVGNMDWTSQMASPFGHMPPSQAGCYTDRPAHTNAIWTPSPTQLACYPNPTNMVFHPPTNAPQSAHPGLRIVAQSDERSPQFVLPGLH